MTSITKTLCLVVTIAVLFLFCGKKEKQTSDAIPQNSSAKVEKRTSSELPALAAAKDSDTKPASNSKEESVVAPVKKMAARPQFEGVDINRYRQGLRSAPMQDVIEMAGKPTKIKRDGNLESWLYEKKCYDGGFGQQCSDGFVINFTRGRFQLIGCRTMMNF